jgi:hypothetical protein
VLVTSFAITGQVVYDCRQIKFEQGCFLFPYHKISSAGGK